MLAKVLPAQVIVFPVAVAEKLICPVYVLVKFEAGRVTLPNTFRVLAPAKVITPSRPLAKKLAQLTEAPTVTVNAFVPVLELTSKKT
jgi:hypothetical protein